MFGSILRCFEAWKVTQTIIKLTCCSFPSEPSKAIPSFLRLLERNGKPAFLLPWLYCIGRDSTLENTEKVDSHPFQKGMSFCTANEEIMRHVFSGVNEFCYPSNLNIKILVMALIFWAPHFNCRIGIKPV